MRGELIEDTALIADLYARVTQSYGVKRAARSMGLGFRNNEVPNHDEFAEAVDGCTCGPSGSLPQHEVTMGRSARL